MEIPERTVGHLDISWHILKSWGTDDLKSIPENGSNVAIAVPKATSIPSQFVASLRMRWKVPDQADLMKQVTDFKVPQAAKSYNPGESYVLVRYDHV